MFDFTKEQEMLRTMVREFAETELAPKALELDKRGEFPRDLVKKLASLGLLGISTTRDLGGSAMGHLAGTIAIEELARVYPSVAFFLEVGTGPVYAISHFGSEEQKKKYIPPVLKGEKIMCIAATEPTGGSELTNLATEAVLSEDGYVINGRKVYITGGGVADQCILLAKTGERASLIMVERGTPGFTIGRRQDQMGLRSVDVSELAFNDCKVSKDSVIGKEGSGLSHRHDDLHGGSARDRSHWSRHCTGGLRNCPEIRERARSLWKAYRPSSGYSVSACRYGF